MTEHVLFQIAESFGTSFFFHSQQNSSSYKTDAAVICNLRDVEDCVGCSYKDQGYRKGGRAVREQWEGG